MNLSRTTIAAAVVAAAMLYQHKSSAQVAPPNLAPAGAYQPIPNFIGTDAGAEFRGAVSDRFSCVQSIAPQVVNLQFINLSAEHDGLVIYCTDCQATLPCTAGGTGAWAFGIKGQWSCAAPNLAANAIFQGETCGGDMGGTFPNCSVQTVRSGMTPLVQGGSGAQLNGLSGSKTDGSDELTGFNVNGAINVKAYGAKGDCTTADTTAIQNAINAALPGQTVYLPWTSSCYKFSNLTIPSNIKLMGGGWVAPFWGASFGQGAYAPVVTTTTGTNTLPSATITVTSTTGFDPATNVPLYVGGQQVFCSGQSGGTSFTGCVGGSGTIASGSQVFQSFVNGTILYSTATSGVAIDWNCSSLSSPVVCNEGGDMEGIFVLGSGTNGSALTVSSITESAGDARLATLTTSTAHGIPTGKSTGLIVAGVGITACTPTALSESGSTVSVTCSGAHGLVAGDEIISAGNTPSGYNGTFIVDTAPTTSTLTFINATTGLGAGTVFGTIKNGNYNRTVLAKSTGTTTLTFDMGTFHDLGSGSGGTATLTSIGLAFGDSAVGAYQSGLDSRHVGVGNFGICASIHEQNAFHDTLSIDGCNTGLFDDGSASTGESNNLKFANLKVAGDPHIAIDWLNATQSDSFDTYDIEETTADPTAMMVVVGDSDHSTFVNGYLESITSTFTGDGIVLRHYSNSDGNVFLNNHITVNTAAHSDFHLIGAGSPTLINNRGYGTTIIESPVGHTTLLNNNFIRVTDNSTETANFNLPGTFAGNQPFVFNNVNSGFVGAATGSGFELVNGANTEDGMRFDGSEIKIGHAFPVFLQGPYVVVTAHELDLFGVAPSLGACGGGSPALTTGAQDQSFEVTSGSATTSCAVNFGTAFGAKPVCTCNDETTAAALKLTPATGSLTVANLTASDVFMCTCRGH